MYCSLRLVVWATERALQFKDLGAGDVVRLMVRKQGWWGVELSGPVFSTLCGISCVLLACAVVVRSP
jgi:hypothetical protein